MNATLPGSSLKDFARVLACFGKIGDEISLEVKTGKVRIWLAIYGLSLADEESLAAESPWSYFSLRALTNQSFLLI